MKETKNQPVIVELEAVAAVAGMAMIAFFEARGCNEPAGPAMVEAIDASDLPGEVQSRIAYTLVGLMKSVARAKRQAACKLEAQVTPTVH